MPIDKPNESCKSLNNGTIDALKEFSALKLQEKEYWSVYTLWKKEINIQIIIKLKAAFQVSLEILYINYRWHHPTTKIKWKTPVKVAPMVNE